MSNVSHIPSPPASPAARQRLRAVRPDEVPPAPDFLPPGATWLPAPGHVLPAVPGGVPMVGYLVLVPADQDWPGAPAAARPRPSRTAAFRCGSTPSAAPRPWTDSRSI